MGFLDNIKKRLFAPGSKPTLGQIDRALADGRRASGVTSSPSPPAPAHRPTQARPDAAQAPTPRAQGVAHRLQPAAAAASRVVGNSSANIHVLSEYERLLNCVTDPACEAILLLGRAGTGKSTAIRWLLQSIGSQTALVAPTGIAAWNIGGQTIHSFFGLPPVWIERDQIKAPPQKTRAVLQSLKYLVIDEISMVNANLMDAVAQSLEMYGPQKGKRFGGVKIVAVGDLLQLPPVVDDDTKPLYAQAGYPTEYFFSARCMRDISWAAIELTRVMRQSDADFVERLGDIRLGRNLNAAVEWINRVSSNSPPKSPAIALVTSNRIADDRNKRELSLLPGPEREYKATFYGKWKLQPAPDLLHLRVGAQVIFLKNDPERRWVNGSLGTVERMEDDAVYVTLRGAERAECVLRAEWETYEHRRDDENDVIVREVVGRFVQFPLKPAWAITIHKAQGQTYDACSVDFGDKAFCAGQAYVALSRCRSIEALHLFRPLRVQDVQVDPRILEFCELVKHAEQAVDAPAAGAASSVPVAAPIAGISGGRPRVFLSHASADSEPAKFVRSILENAGFECWFAPTDIEATAQGFVDSLANSLGASDVLLVLVSEQSQQSEWVKREIYMSVSTKRPILPVWTSPQRGRLNPSFEFLLGPCQDATLGPSAVDELPRRLRELLAMNDASAARLDGGHATVDKGDHADEPRN